MKYQMLVKDSPFKLSITARYYTNSPCDCSQYTRIFSRGTLNCMDVLSMQFKVLRKIVLVYWPQSHWIFVILYF